MTDGNWAKHAKILGKLCLMWDDAAANITTLGLDLAALADQAATGVAAGNNAMILISGYVSALNTSIANGPTAIQAQIKAITQAYLVSTEFTADLVTNPAATAAITDVISAFGKEMASDSKSFTTAGSTGLIHFLKALFGTPSPTDYAASGSPTHADATYVVSSQV